MKRLGTLSCIGLIVGTIFGLTLKGIENLTDKKVYTLLLNVDYFPVLGDITRTELFDFSLHLIVSMILVIVLYYSLQLLNRVDCLMDYIWINTAIAVLLYMTTTFSERTPSLTDMVAFLYWTGGHVIFGLLTGGMILYTKKNID